jgi:cob(I)alamin adenosyltransferase
MPRITRIYTRSGDDGTTSLGDRSRVSKDSLRVSAYGEVDELNSAIGLALALGVSDLVRAKLSKVQNELFNLGTDLAFPKEDQEIELPTIELKDIKELETIIDAFADIVGPLENFVLPGGTPGAAALHLARTICRRAERTVVALAGEAVLSEHSTSYLNRLSDALFIMARYENRLSGQNEMLWDSHS